MRDANPRRRLFWVGCFLMLVTLGLYAPVLRHDFVQYDDQDYVTDNPHVRAGLTAAGVVWAFTQTRSANWHPMTWLSHMLDAEFFGLCAGGHHLVNVILHAFNAVFVLLVFWRLTGAVWRAAVVAAWFAWHPLHVESVAWVAERKDVLSTLFGLAAIWFYAGYAKAAVKPTPRRRLRYAASLVCLALSLASKPMLVTLPCVLLLLDMWPLGRVTFTSVAGALPALRRLAIEKLPFFALSLVSSIITFSIQRQAGAMAFAQELSLHQRAANALVSCARYLGKTIWPQPLAAPYPHPGDWPRATVILAAAILLGMAALVVWRWRRQPWLATGWLWFLGSLVPVSGLVQVGAQSMADRYTYWPLIGVFVALVWTLVDWTGVVRHRLRVAQVVTVVATVAFALRTWTQIPVWRDTETLFRHAIAVTRNNWIAHYNLAMLAMRLYQDTQRASLSTQVLASPPPAKPARDFLAEVEQHCRAAIAARPQYPEPHVTLAKALTEQGRLPEAQALLEGALALSPKLHEAHQNLAEIFHRQGRVQKAIPEYQAALRLKPDWDAVLNNLAWLLATHPRDDLRNGAEAVRLARRACALTGHTNLWYLHTLAAAEAETGAFSNAVQTATAALQLAVASGQKPLSDKAAARVALYRLARPLRDPPPAP